MTTIINHFHHCPRCGSAWCEELTFLAEPLEGEFKGELIHLPARTLTIVGTGHRLRQFVRAPWVSAALQHGIIYGFTLEFGVVKIRTKTLKRLARRFGGAFVHVAPGILVALGACFRPCLAQKLVGQLGGMAGGRHELHWVTLSKRGAKRLKARLHELSSPPPRSAPPAMAAAAVP